MMKNDFFITACRFSTKEKEKFYIIGYFQNNDRGESAPVIMLDEMILSYNIIEKSLAPMKYKVMNGKTITKQYFLEAAFPEEWRRYQKLTVYNSYDKKKEHLLTLKMSKIQPLSLNVPQNVDLVRREADGMRIDGWYIDNGSSQLEFINEKGEILDAELTCVKRKDVMDEYPENEESEVVGYSAYIRCEVNAKVTVCVTNSGNRAEQYAKVAKPGMADKCRQAMSMPRKAVDYYRQFGLEATVTRMADKMLGREYSRYEEWFRRYQPSRVMLRKQRKCIFASMPKISIVVPLYRTPENYLSELINSIAMQSYQNWELCLSDGSGADSPIRNLLDEYQKKDARIRVIHNDQQLHISDNTNQALKVCTGDYIAFADHDDLLTPDALYECVCAINEYPDVELIYSDEDKVNADGTEYFFPHFKSDYNLDLLRSVNYFCHLVVVKRSLYEKAGLLRSKYDGAQDYDFVLRCAEQTEHIYHIPKILYHWRMCEGSTAESGANKAYIIEAGKAAIQSHYERLNIKARVIPTQYPGMYRTIYDLPEKPLVSVIIPNKDHVEDLDKCMRSLENKNRYENIEYLIVENNSVEQATFDYYKLLEARNPKVKVLFWKEKGFNYSAINNFGVQHAKGEYILLLNNDTEILKEDCIEELLSYCMREEVGAVGARLYFEDGTVQHAGVIVGLGGVAGHAFLGAAPEDPGYFARAILAQDLSAVTAACIMIKKSVYEEVEGLEEAYAVAFNDVDLCMKIRKAGYLIVYNPNAELMHYESKSRGYEDTEEKIRRFQSEIQLFQSRWKEFLEEGDPYYNPNLSLDRNDFGLEFRGPRKRGKKC